MHLSKTCKQLLTDSKANSKGCSSRASLIGLSILVYMSFASPAVFSSTFNATSDGSTPESKTDQSHATTSDTLRVAAMEYAEACNFDHARAKLEEDIALNHNFDKSRLPESWLLMGNVYRLEGLYPDAREWITRGVSAIEKLKPQDKKRLSAAYNYLALLNNSAGEFAESEKNARKAVNFSIEAALGKENEAMHRVVLANALRQQGKYKEALPELETAISILKNGEQKRLLAAATNNLGALYFWMGDYNRSLTLLQDGLKQRLLICGENHPDVANSYLDLGCVEFKLGEISTALDHLENAHEIRVSKLGANHPETLSSAANLAVVLLASGNVDRALQLLQHAVETGKTVLGLKNADLAQYEDDYANALAENRQFDLARATQADANAIRKSVFGVNSREFAGGLRSLAQIESAAGNKKECRSLLLRSISIYTDIGQNPDLDRAETLDELASYYAENDELENARQTFALAIREKLKTGNSVSYATSLANLSELLHRMNQEAESAVMLKKAAIAIETLSDAQKHNPDCKAILERYKALQDKSKD